jgi:membrane protease YdiL (CAAX protease family)
VDKPEHDGDAAARPEPNGAHIPSPDSLVPGFAAPDPVPAREFRQPEGGPADAAPQPYASPYAGPGGGPAYGYAPAYAAPPWSAVPAATPPEPAPAPEPDAEDRPRISVRRAFGEIGAVYVVSFGLGIVSALALLTDPALSGDQQISGWADALSEIMQYVMQGCVVIFGVGYFSLRRGLTLKQIFGRFDRREQSAPTGPYDGFAPAPGPYQPPQAAGYPPYNGQYPVAPPYPAQQQALQQQPLQQQAPVPSTVPPWSGGYQPNPYQPNPPGAAFPQGGLPLGYPMASGHGYGYFMPKPAQRGPGWQFARAFFVSMTGLLGFLIIVSVYSYLTTQQTGAPNQGTSLWILPLGVVTGLAAGFGEELLVTGMVVTTLEQTRLRDKVWLYYVVAICLRIPFHLYYGWASLGVICFTMVNMWAYRRWRLLWPIVLAHAVYDAIQFFGTVAPPVVGSLMIIGLGLTTVVMAIVVLCIEISDGSARRRYRGLQTAQPEYVTNTPF